MTLIENYVDQKRKSNPFGFTEDFRYKNTTDIALADDKAGVADPTIIRTPYWNNLLMFSPVVVVGVIVTYQTIPKHTWLWPLLFTIFITVVLLITTIRSKQNPEITLTADHQKLVIKNSTYLWAEIMNTYIMTQYDAKKNNKWLVIQKSDGSFNDVSIQFVGISDRKLAAIVEYYKKSNTSNP
jgi:hypothetical protein